MGVRVLIGTERNLELTYQGRPRVILSLLPEAPPRLFEDILLALTCPLYVVYIRSSRISIYVFQLFPGLSFIHSLMPPLFQCRMCRISNMIRPCNFESKSPGSTSSYLHLLSSHLIPAAFQYLRSGFLPLSLSLSFPHISQQQKKNNSPSRRHLGCVSRVVGLKLGDKGRGTDGRSKRGVSSDSETWSRVSICFSLSVRRG